jgi:hypothetical protein
VFQWIVIIGAVIMIALGQAAGWRATDDLQIAAGLR